jgi:hypothetical protein
MMRKVELSAYFSHITTVAATGCAEDAHVLPYLARIDTTSMQKAPAGLPRRRFSSCSITTA